MKVAVTDACIFIDLIECDACSSFFQLPFQFITSYQVWSELEDEQVVTLNEWVKSKKLHIEQTDPDFLELLKDKSLSTSLSIADLSVWFLCDTSGDILLTSDGLLRSSAKKHAMETHGLLWLFDQMVKHQLMSKTTATTKLQSVFNNNIYYSSNTKLIKAFEKMVKGW